MTVMTAARTELPTDRPLTVEDLDLLPDDGFKYELDDGVLVMTPPPAVDHQLVLHQLQLALGAACPDDLVVLPGPGVVVNEFQYRIPDLVVVRANSISFTDKTINKPPVVALEVASPSTAIYDRNRKKDVYAEFGIQSYWIVVPSLDKPRVIAFELRRGRYHQVADVSGDEAFDAERPFAVRIVPSALVTGPWAS